MTRTVKAPTPAKQRAWPQSARDYVQHLEARCIILATRWDAAQSEAAELRNALADLASRAHAHAARIAPPPPAADKRRPNCRDRLAYEGKPYPRSGCDACHKRLGMTCPDGPAPAPRSRAPFAERPAD